jgi:hypothetical protein
MADLGGTGGRSGRNEALLSKLDRTMDSILSANADIAFKPRLHPRYGVARLVAWLTSLLGWAAILACLAGIGLVLGIGSIEELADLTEWIEVPWLAGGAVGGLVLVNLAALTRGTLDGADYQRQLLQLAVARSMRGLGRSRPHAPRPEPKPEPRNVPPEPEPRPPRRGPLSGRRRPEPPADDAVEPRFE